MNELNNMPTIDLVKELAYLEQDIGLKTLKYNKIVEELTKRYPKVEVFKEQEKIIRFGGNKNVK